jgi:hypothetical protein
LTSGLNIVRVLPFHPGAAKLMSDGFLGLIINEIE